MSEETMEELFGELRSLVHAHKDGQWLTALTELIERAVACDRARYMAQWRDYIMSSVSFEEMYWSVIELREARRWAEHLPSLPLHHTLYPRQRIYDRLHENPFLDEDLALLSSLSVSYSGLGIEHIAWLGESPHLSTLRKLDLRYNDLFVRGTLKLCEMHNMPALRELDLSNNRITRRAVQGLMQDNPFMQHMKSLVLSRNNFGREELHALFVEGKNTSLEALDLSSNNALRGHHLEALHARDAYAFTLRELRLDENRVSAEGASNLARAPALSGLERLHLSHARLGDEGFGSLCRSPHLQALRELHVKKNQIKVEGLKHLNGAFQQGQLEVLDLGTNTIGPRGAAALGVADALRSVRQLTLERCGIKDKGLKSLLDSPHLGAVERLDLGSNGLTQTGLALLGSSAAVLPKLRDLTLDQGKFGADALIRFLESPLFASLDTLSLCNMMDVKTARVVSAHPALARLRKLTIGSAGHDQTFTLFKEAPQLSQVWVSRW